MNRCLARLEQPQGYPCVVARAPERSPDARHAVAVQELAERCGLPVDQVKDLLSTLEAQPTVTGEAFLRQIVEAWLADQRESYRAGERGG